jgi:hypothetical protein
MDETASGSTMVTLNGWKSTAANSTPLVPKFGGGIIGDEYRMGFIRLRSHAAGYRKRHETNGHKPNFIQEVPLL